MEDVLDVYAAPYDPAHPVVCFDESPKQLIGEVRDPQPPQPGTPARQDTEYQRNGVRDLMMICEPKRGVRDVLVMERRTKIEFAHCMRHIVELYPAAESIRVVLDNLNTHKLASLYEAFPPRGSTRHRQKAGVSLHPKAWQLAEYRRDRVGRLVQFLSLQTHPQRRNPATRGRRQCPRTQCQSNSREVAIHHARCSPQARTSLSSRFSVTDY